jgi:hypothetical protein
MGRLDTADRGREEGRWRKAGGTRRTDDCAMGWAVLVRTGPYWQGHSQAPMRQSAGLISMSQSVHVTIVLLGPSPNEGSFAPNARQPGTVLTPPLVRRRPLRDQRAHGTGRQPSPGQWWRAVSHPPLLFGQTRVALDGSPCPQSSIRQAVLQCLCEPTRPRFRAASCSLHHDTTLLSGVQWTKCGCCVPLKCHSLTDKSRLTDALGQMHALGHMNTVFFCALGSSILRGNGQIQYLSMSLVCSHVWWRAPVSTSSRRGCHGSCMSPVRQPGVT